MLDLSHVSAERKAFVTWVLSKEGRPYCWPSEENNYSGKDLKLALYKNVYDCSGLVTAGLYAASGGRIDWRAMGNCRRLINPVERKSLPPLPPLLEPLRDDEEPQSGELCFYGPGKNAPNHVMVYLSDGRVFGASGGNRFTTSPERAAKIGARVRFRDSPLYRPDFLGFWKNPL